MKIWITIFVFGLSLGTTFGQGLKGALNKVKQQVGLDNNEDGDVGMGLKAALDQGIAEAVSFLSQENGYLESPYKILLPEEAQQVVNKLKVVPGFSNYEEELIEKLNRAAEDAAIKAKPIFVDAIKAMTFQDAMNLLMGEQDAATRYLEKTTYDRLFEAFQPVIHESLNKVNAIDYWKKGTTAYNKIPFTKSVNPDLDQHVTQRALAGLFELIEQKELDIRENPGARTTELLQKVFAKQDK